MNLLGSATLTAPTASPAAATTWTALDLASGSNGQIAAQTVTALSATVLGTFACSMKVSDTGSPFGLRVYFTVAGTRQTNPAFVMESKNTAGVLTEIVPVTCSEVLAVTPGSVAIGVAIDYYGAAALAALPGVLTVLETVSGFRQNAGPFTATLAADQTNTDLNWGGMVGGFVATRAGSIVGLSAQIDAAITGASKTATFKVTKNGTEIAGSGVAMTTGGAETSGKATYTAGTYTFAAGDVIGVSYTSTTITNTPKAACSIEIYM